MKKWIRYFIIKTLQFFGIDIIKENKELQDRVLELENNVKWSDSKRKENYLEARVPPPGYRIEKNNLLIEEKSGIKYCWNCYNKINGSEFRVLEGNEYSLRCHVCGVSTILRNPPQQANNDYDIFKF